MGWITTRFTLYGGVIEVDSINFTQIHLLSKNFHFILPVNNCYLRPFRTVNAHRCTIEHIVLKNVLPPIRANSVTFFCSKYLQPECVLFKLYTVNNIEDGIQFLPDSFFNSGWYVTFDFFQKFGASSSICYGAVHPSQVFHASSTIVTEPPTSASRTDTSSSEWMVTASNAFLRRQTIMCFFMLKNDGILNIQGLVG